MDSWCKLHIGRCHGNLGLELYHHFADFPDRTFIQICALFSKREYSLHGKHHQRHQRHGNKDAVLAFIQLLEKDDVAYASLQSLRKCKDGSTYASQLVEDLLRSQMKLSDIGEEMLLPKLLAALSQPENNFACDDTNNV